MRTIHMAPMSTGPEGLEDAQGLRRAYSLWAEANGLTVTDLGHEGLRVEGPEEKLVRLDTEAGIRESERVMEYLRKQWVRLWKLTGEGKDDATTGNQEVRD